MQITVKPVIDQITWQCQYKTSLPGVSIRVDGIQDTVHTGTFGHQRKNRIHKRIDNKSNNVVGDIDQELMPSLRIIRLK